MDGSTLRSSFFIFTAVLLVSTAQARQQASTDPVSAETVARESSAVTQSAVADVAVAPVSAPVASNWWSDIDSNADGKISAVEAKAYAGLEKRFVAIDADHDGFVKLEEYRTFFASNVGKNP